MKCNEVREILYDAMYDLLDPDLRERSNAHCAECESCLREKERVERADRLLDAWQVHYDPRLSGRARKPSRPVLRHVAMAAAAMVLVALGYFLRDILQRTEPTSDFLSQARMSLDFYVKVGDTHRSAEGMSDALRQDPARVRTLADLANSHPNPKARDWFAMLIEKTEFRETEKARAIPVFYELIVRYLVEDSVPEMASPCVDMLCRLKGIGAQDRERMVLMVESFAELRVQTDQVRTVFEEAVSNLRELALSSIRGQ